MHQIDEPAGGARITRHDQRWTVDLDPSDDRAEEMLRSAVAAIRAGGGGTAQVWARDGDTAPGPVAVALGFRLAREVLQLRRPLPVEEPWELDVRPFVPGQDEEAWLEVNNRAFAWHPEQSDWTLEELRAKEQEPWFDPDGFLLHEVDGRLLGFCWTKVHAHTAPPLGEIFVIAVDPDVHQRGLGRALVLAGLAHLHERGLDVGMLYVDATNAPAVRLYDRMGFTRHHTDRCYQLEVPAP